MASPEKRMRPSSGVREKKFISFLAHPVGAALLTFLTTGVGASLFSNMLESMSKKRDLQLAASQRAIDSVKIVTDLIFERDTRANFIASSIRRRGKKDEITARKKAYDDVFVRYNSTIQSNFFRIREIFHSADYTEFESLAEGPLRDLLMAEDKCITKSFDLYDADNASDSIAAEAKDRANEQLRQCDAKTQGPHIAFFKIHDAIIHCEYVYSDALYHIVQQVNADKSYITLKAVDVRKACDFPSEIENRPPSQ